MGSFHFFALLLLSSQFLGGSAVTRINPFRSPRGAMNIDISPMINQVSESVLPGCDTVSFEPSQVLQESMLWPWSGLHGMTRAVYDEYKTQMRLNQRTLRFTDINEATPRRLNAKDSSVVSEKAVQCTARRMVLNDLSMSGAVCSCLSSETNEGYCNTVDAFALSVHCHDKMAAAVDRQKICPALLTESRGVELSEMCSGWVAGIVSSLNIDLYTLNFPENTPDQVDAKVAAQEARAYYVAWKAIEKFTKFTDAHLLCSKGNEDNESLKDLEVLPTWQPKIYFWITDPSGKQRVPIAMLAQRSNEQMVTDLNTLIVIRNIRTSFEGRLFLTNQLSRRFLDVNPDMAANVGMVHEGYDAVATQLLSPLRQFLKEHFKTLVSPRPKINIVAHGNFGSGVGAIIARDLSLEFKLANGNLPIEHNFIAFEGGPVGDYAFTDELKRSVNVRNVVSDMSGFSELPCEMVKGCPGYKHQVHTGAFGERIGPFMPLPGRVTVDTAHLSEDVWRTNATKLETVANMACAAPCWLSTKFCPDDPAPTCSYANCGAFVSDEARNVVAI